VSSALAPPRRPERVRTDHGLGVLQAKRKQQRATGECAATSRWRRGSHRHSHRGSAHREARRASAGPAASVKRVGRINSTSRVSSDAGGKHVVEPSR